MDHENTSPTSHSARYKPLVDADLETEPGELKWALRCVTVAPGHGSEPVRCKLVDFTLGRAQQTYEALSYTWGDRMDQATIHLDGKPLNVTKNLETALRCLRRQNAERLLWVDAICIDQSDVAEVNLQVQRMWAIYQYASRVVVFLGEEKADTVQAVALVETIAKDVKVGDYDRITSMLNVMKAKSSRLALQRLMRSPWWSRAWVVQEFSVAAAVVFVCGSVEMASEVFGKALEVLLDYRFNAVIPPRQEYFMREIAATPISHLWTARKEYQATKPTLQKRVPLSLLYRFRGFGASDPKDKVFSLFHIMGEIAALRPDYTRSVRDLFKDVVRTSIELSDTLQILCHHNRMGKSILDLPTWCPDWSIKRGQRILLWQNGYTAGGDSKPVARFEEDKLWLQGKLLDSIQWLVSFEPKVFRNKGLLFDQIKTIEARLVQQGISQRGEGASSVPSLESFHRTIVGSRVRERGPQHGATLLGESDAEVYWDAWHEQMIAASHDALHGKAKVYNDALYSALAGRSFFATEKGHIGLADNPADAGDVVGVFSGSRVLFCLRETMSRLSRAAGGSEDQFELIGECYLHGFMDGEAGSGDEDQSSLCLI
ncbi:Putative heterokaryon incompatibility [Colletotrichum destructivum]|uniref:Heterokaryon incompatibility n=1 Tax=Colletotrichum destructivum TaxID=34406 RepID=A0AAX4IMJ2_9PEZI|nr:Putative heterokaryon incompatibility [Colletotrichum destructivum]